ncbi:urease accessory protein UreD [Enterococcus ratti]|uniref:urease accessory protein UreD n=1 Tax=Enterococcus ratti TaxID=150033 RepID=UPI0035139002
MIDKADGIIDLLFAQVSGRTIAKKVYHEGNSRISSNVRLLTEDTPCYYLISTGGGFVEGESYVTKLEVLSGSHVIVKNQTPTYVYKCENEKTTTQKNLVKLTAGFLEYLTHEVIPYKKAIYEQETIIRMDSVSTLVYSDGVTAGWSEDEQVFTFNQLKQKTKIFFEEELVFNDYLFLNPKEQPMTELGYFEGKTNYNTLIIIDPAIDEEFVHELRVKLSQQETTLRYGLSLLSVPGIVLRVLGNSAAENKQLIYSAINYFRAKYHQLPHLNDQI